MRWVKWVLAVLAAIVVLVFVTFYIIIATYDFNRLKPRISGAVQEATGRELKLAGDFKFAFGFFPSVSLEGLSLQNSPWGSRPEMARIKRLEIQIALLPLFKGEIRFKRLILSEPDILMETDRSGKSNFDFERKGGGVFPPLTFDEIRIENGVLTYRDGKRGKTSALTIEEMKAALPGGENPIELHLKGSYAGRPLEIQGRTGPLSAVFFPEKPWPVNLNARAGAATLAIEGTIKEVLKGKGLDLALRAEGASIRDLAELGGIPGLPDLGAFKVTSGIKGNTKNLKITDFKAGAGGSDAAGSAELDLSGKIPKITADLSSRKLDLRPFFPAKEKKIKMASPPSKAPREDKIFSRDPLPLEKLKSADARIKIQAGNLLLRNLTLTGFRADLVLDAGLLSAKELNFDLNGGTVNGQFSVNTRGKDASFAANLNAAKLNAGSLLKDLGVREILDGKLSAEMKASGQGMSIAEWMAGLNGRTFFNLEGGRINNKYLNLWGEDLGRSVLRLIHPVSTGEDSTPVNCFVSGFDIKNGLASCSALVLDTNQMSVVGGGDINLKDERLNLSLQPFPKKEIAPGRVGQASLSLGELAKPFKLGGTLAHPSLMVDVNQTVTTLGKALQGMARSGPAGILESMTPAGPGDKNPCLTAIEAARKGGRPAKKAQDGKGPAAEPLEELGKGLRDLFKR